jgi:two-component system sensor histidine kinase YesM
MQRMTSFRRRSLQITLLVIVPIIICLVACGIYILNAILNTNVSQAFSARLTTIGQNAEVRLSAIESYMISFVVAGTDFNVLSFPVNHVKLFDSTQRILERYRNIMYTDAQLTGFLITSPINDYYRIIENKNVGYIAAKPLRAYLDEGMAQGTLDQSNWFLDEIDGTLYLLRVMSLGSAHQMCFVNAENFLNDLLRGANPNEILSFGSRDDQSPAYRLVWESGQRRIILRDEKSELFAPLVLNAPYDIDVLPLQWVFISITLLALLAFIPLGIVIFRKVLLYPMEQFDGTLERIRGGRMDARMDYRGNVVEYDEVSRSFNEMMNEIQELKIRQYEQALEVQRTELQYLHLQIRPHFYLNCLKIVYSLAECRDFSRIQRLILLLSDYLRGIWRNTYAITVQDEMHHVSTFIALNNMCNEQAVVYTEDVDLNASGILLPPLLVLTFVENAVKHGRTSGKQLHITVRMQRMDTPDGSYLNVSISDNGPGFTPEQLQSLNSPDGIHSDRQQQFGIYNIRERLQLVYQGRANLAFLSAGGASVEVFIPCEKETEALDDSSHP